MAVYSQKKIKFQKSLGGRPPRKVIAYIPPMTSIWIIIFDRSRVQIVAEVVSWKFQKKLQMVWIYGR